MLHDDKKEKKLREIYKKARAKINLSLEVVGKREDGYHNIQSIFQKINLYDELYIKKTKTDGIEIQCNKKELKKEENIIYQAYQILKESYKTITGIQVRLQKKIPMQAGLAGGSTDCASFLEGMNQLFDLKLSQKEMEEIGKKLGADVVPCFYNRAVLAEGIGEKITDIATHFKYYIVLIKPQMCCNTKEMFQKMDEKGIKNQAKSACEIIQALEQQEIELLAHNLYNQFEEVVEEKALIESLKKELLQQGAKGSLMTGTGSCVYGIFANKNTARIAYQNLKRKYETYIGTSYNLERN